MTRSAPSSTLLRVVGVDVATQPKSVGLALARLHDERLRLEEVAVEASWDAIDARVCGWIDEPTLIAIDAPLGWPAPLSRALRDHAAGGALDAEANALFRRRTDDVVASALRKRPLDVGADRIARTAHAALGLLQRLRAHTGKAIPLPLAPGPVEATSAIEVYPAGTLASRGLPSSGYKGAGEAAQAVRSRILEGLGAEMELPAEATRRMTASDHVLDAALCCLAARDFTDRAVLEPDDVTLARHEGWIWVARPLTAEKPA